MPAASGVNEGLAAVAVPPDPVRATGEPSLVPVVVVQAVDRPRQPEAQLRAGVLELVAVGGEHGVGDAAGQVAGAELHRNQEPQPQDRQRAEEAERHMKCLGRHRAYSGPVGHRVGLPVHERLRWTGRQLERNEQPCVPAGQGRTTSADEGPGSG